VKILKKKKQKKIEKNAKENKMGNGLGLEKGKIIRGKNNFLKI